MTLQYIAVLTSAAITLFLIYRCEHWKRKYQETKDIDYLEDMQQWRRRYFALERKTTARLSDDEFDNPTLGDG